MPDPNIVIVDGQGTRHVFPPGFDPQRAAFIVRTQSGASSQPDTPSTSTALSMAGATASIPALTDAVTNFATSPNVPKATAALGRGIGGMAPIAAGYAEAGIPGAIGGATLSAAGAWSGGKTGWFTGKLAQNLSALPARAMNAALPYLQALSTVSGAQGLLDLAQMADPNRSDIGTLGIGKSSEPMTLDDALHGMKAANLRHGLGITSQEVEAITNQIAAGAKPQTAISVLADPKRIAAFKSLVKLNQ